MATVLITGASGGIGLELAKIFANDGYDLVLTARSENKLLELQKELSAQYDACSYVFPCDLADKDAALFAPLNEATAKSGIALDTLPCALNNAAAFEQLATADAVVLAETVGASSYSDIYREIEMCERLQRPILGAFILQ